MVGVKTLSLSLSLYIYIYIYNLNKVSLQTNLEKNPTNSPYIFILSVNFENLIIRLHVLITSLILTKFKENQISITMSSNKCYNFKFL